MIVAEPGQTNVSALEAPVKAAQGQLAVVVHEGCRSNRVLQPIVDSARRAAERSGAGDASVRIEIDPRTATVELAFDPKSTFWSKFALTIPAELVTVRSRRVAPGARCGDGVPHYGGSVYGPTYSSGCSNISFCSSGFKVRRNHDGRIGMSAAGHCRQLNPGWSGNLYSATQYFGEFYNWNFGNLNDYGFISGSSYSKTIYTDPTQPATRSVAGTTTNNVGNGLCVSGSLTTARCALIVQSLGAWNCFGGYCALNVHAQRAVPGVVCQQGDSGGPAYSSTTTTNALIRGTISFVNDPPDNNCYFNDVSFMQSGGFTVMTT